MSPRPIGTTSDLRERILAAAWRQIAEQGAPALALRAIARSLNIAAPSIYNHFADRDTLVSALIVEAFTQFGSWQIEARQSVDPADLPGQLRAIGVAYRDWALRFPERYHLIFGTPIPGYKAPIEQVGLESGRAISPLLQVIGQLKAQQRLRVDLFDGFAAVQLTPQMLVECPPPPMPDDQPFDLVVFSVAMLIWSRVHGFVSLELDGGLPPIGIDRNALFEVELESISRQYVLP